MEGREQLFGLSAVEPGGPGDLDRPGARSPCAVVGVFGDFSTQRLQFIFSLKEGVLTAIIVFFSSPGFCVCVCVSVSPICWLASVAGRGLRRMRVRTEVVKDH